MLEQDPTIACFKDEKGDFYKVTYDAALMFPLFEIDGPKRRYFNPIPLYYYRLYPRNDHVVLGLAEQKRVETEIRGKPSFKVNENFLY